MKLYFTDSQIPELAGLTRQQRRLVREGALAMLRSDSPSAAAILPVLGGAFAAGLALVGNGLSHALGTEHKVIIMVAFGFAGVIIGSFLGAQFLTHRLRPYFRRFVQAHTNEIQAA